MLVALVLALTVPTNEAAGSVRVIGVERSASAMLARSSVVTPAMNANLPDPGGSVLSGTHTIGRCKNIHNQSLSAPWMPPGQFKPGSPNFGCVNAPEYRAIAFNYADALLAAGGDAIQHDDAAAGFVD